MKIVLAAKCVYPFHPVGGVQKYVYYFAKSLQKKGVDLEIVTPLDNGKPRTEQYEGLSYTFLKPSIYKYLEYPIGWLGVHLFSNSLARYLRNKKFDVLHSFDMTGYQYLKLKPRKPVIAHIFTDNYLCNPIPLRNPFNVLNLTGTKFEKIKEEKIPLSPFADSSIKKRYWAQLLFKVKPMHFCLSQADRIFFEADVFRKQVTELYRLDAHKGDIIPVGVDVEMVRQSLNNIPLSRTQLGWDEQDIVLLTVNRLAADKGIDKILLALKEIIKKNPRVKLMIIGAGYQEKEIYAIIEQNGLSQHIRHFKNVPEKDLYAYYKISDIYISAFSFPGSSISTLEAMAANLPLITTAQPWLVDHNKNGVVIENNHPETIKKAVELLIQDGQLKQKGEISRQIVADFNWDRIADKAIAAYKKLL